jgi:hypothetical protein
MSSQSARFHSQKAEEWHATQKKGRLRYSLIYGSIWGAFMIFVKVLNIGVEDGLAALSWQLIYDEWIWIPFGILSFYTLFWWVNGKIYSRKKKKNIA